MTQRKSSISSIGVNWKYIRDYHVQEEDGKRVLLPSTKAMHWCMMACGMNRIFSEQDLREFFFRLPITLHSLHLLDNWFAYDHLMNYKAGDQNLSFSSSDIFAHYGIEIVDSVDNYIPRTQFFEGLEEKLRSVMFVGVFTGIEIIPFERDAATVTTYIKVDKVSHLINDKLIHDAEFFAEDVLKLAPKDMFAHQDRFDGKLVEIEERKRMIAELPKFDLAALPADIQDRCMNLMFDKNWIADVKLSSPEDYQDLSEKYILLAWLFANDLMIEEDGLTHSAEGVDLDPEEYEEDVGTNLLLTYEKYNMEEVVPLLKGLFF